MWDSLDKTATAALLEVPLHQECVQVKARMEACAPPVKPWLQAPVHQHMCVWTGACAHVPACAHECVYVAGTCAL